MVLLRHDWSQTLRRHHPPGTQQPRHPREYRARDDRWLAAVGLKSALPGARDRTRSMDGTP